MGGSGVLNSVILKFCIFFRNLAKLVEFTLGKHNFPNFLVGKMGKKIGKKNTSLDTHNIDMTCMQYYNCDFG